MKKCFKCGLEKERSLFYKHPMMGDGLLGKCIECTKVDVANRIALKRNDRDWVAKERARCRLKSCKRRMDGKATKTNEESKRQWMLRNAHKKTAQNKARRARMTGVITQKFTCEDCGKQNCKLHMHHEDYSKPLDVVFLCTTCHGKRHWKDRVK